MRHIAFCAATLCLTASAVAAFDRISDRGSFMEAVGGKDLRIGIYGLTLNVLDNGVISGRAVGYDITGSWSWEDGFFCRDMDWSGYPIEYNCQLVEVDGDRIRFTVDQGAGDDAVLRIR